MQQAQRVAGNVRFFDAHPPHADARAEILEGLKRPRKMISPKWFYDAEGSALFEAITRLPEYYPTRTEKRILLEQSDAIAAACGDDIAIIEPGSGNSEKIRLLLDVLRPAHYVPLDISADFLAAAAEDLGAEYPWLTVDAICADFNDFPSYLSHLPEGRRVVFYPGSTLGNLEPPEALHFLQRVHDLVGDGGGLLIGVDLHKAVDVLEAAYNDSAGVTAAFNRNILHRVNALLGSDFDPNAFAHRAFYNEEVRRIEMHLVSREAQVVSLGDGQSLGFEEGESIHTESSYKYSLEDFRAMAARAGLAAVHSWTDDAQLFSVHYLVSGG